MGCGPVAVGGLPTQFLPGYPMSPYAGQAVPVGQPYYGQPNYANQARPIASAAPRAPQRPYTPRAQAPREEAPANPDRLRIPSPEECGVRTARSAPANNTASLDWGQVRRRLDQLGATGFHLERQGSGFRFVCQLPGGSVDGVAGSESEAVRLALVKAEARR